MNIRIPALILLTGILFSFSGDNGITEFSYPNVKNTTMTLSTGLFKKFKQEWRGQDYYYSCEDSESGIICSVLYYKLNKEEQDVMVRPFKGITTPMIPLLFFADNSNLKDFESNNDTWGEIKDDFMFRQNDILEMRGMKIRQKNMYAYGMFGDDLFVNIHLSKVNYTTADSTAMRQILSSLKKIK